MSRAGNKRQDFSANCHSLVATTTTIKLPYYKLSYGYIYLFIFK